VLLNDSSTEVMASLIAQIGRIK
jgi:predicted transcriptional regulator